MTAIHPEPVALRKRESHVWAREDSDFYVEPAWCSERLFQEEKFEGEVWDPACGIGRIVKAARGAGLSGIGTDLVDRGFEYYTLTDFTVSGCDTAANIVCNPPFKLAEEFALRALKLAERKVAMLLPSKWLHGDKRSRWLETTPLRRVWFLTPRPSMPPGQVIQNGGRAGNGTVDFAWFVWLRGYDGAAEIRWLRRDPMAVPR
jgi:hypothetical protein